jgi:transposase
VPPSRCAAKSRLPTVPLGQLGGARKNLSAAQAEALLAGVRPRDVAGKTRRRLAADHIAELVVIDKRIKNTDVELRELIEAAGSTLLELYGVGPSGAARLLGDVEDVSRFADKGRFASWNGTAPLDASSGDQHRHRLTRAGNRQINRVLHIMALTELRQGGEGRRRFDRETAAGKTKTEAMRCLKRRLSDIVYGRLKPTPNASPRSAERAREDNRGRHFNPARPTHTRHRHFGSVTSRTRRATS